MSARAADPPLVLLTGASGAIGRALADALDDAFRLVGIDRHCDGEIDCLEVDLTDPASIDRGLAAFERRYGRRIASVVHLAAYFDFSGDDHPLYREVNVEGTGRLLAALQRFEVEQFIYTSTMLVHRPGQTGERIDEDTPLEPRWAYPQSKLEAERTIAAQHGGIPYVILRFAGLYDEDSMVPTLAQQIARIHQRDLQSHLAAGDPQAGQAMLHREDLVDAVRRTIERRAELPSGTALLIGESDAPGYDALQDRIGQLLHGEQAWATLRLPAPLAKAGAWLQNAAEPLVPDLIDHGEKPFIKPFMIDRASDHYALDTRRARRLLGWQPRHRLQRTLPRMIANLQRDPAGWYRRNGITPPGWLVAADEVADDPEALRAAHLQAFRAEHGRTLWARFGIVALASWLLSSPLMFDYGTPPLALSDLLSGLLLLALGLLCLSWRFANLRWAVALLACWVMFAPLAFWTPSAAAYANATLVGVLLIAFAAAVPPLPGIAALAARCGPQRPPDWDISPSTWMQRAPIILLAFVGLYVSRYLTAYQLEHVDGVWEPFFRGSVPGKNGTEQIITSEVSEAWPVPDAGLGALTYALEILTGLIGSNHRWRTMPWLVVLFGIMIVPLGAVSIFFIVIQPIVIGTWCTLCLIAAAAMLVQIPYSLDELLATGQFLLRRKRVGRSLWRVFFTGDTDDGDQRAEPDDFERSPLAVLRDMWGGGVGLPWNLAASIVIGLSLLLTRLTFGSDGAMADADHLIGALVVTVSVTALAEVARPLRYLNALFGAALCVTPFVFDASPSATVASVIAGLLLVVLCLRRGAIRMRWGGWERFMV